MAAGSVTGVTGKDVPGKGAVHQNKLESAL